MKMRPEIRKADPVEDFGAVLTGARDFVTFVNRPDVLPASDSGELEKAVQSMIALPQITVLLAEVDGVVMGGFGYMVIPNLWNRSLSTWEEIFWWVYPEAPPETAMLLLRQAWANGKAAGATVFTAHKLETSPRGVDIAYRRLGMKPVQTTYMGAV